MSFIKGEPQILKPVGAESLKQLWLMQLSDSALPIGAMTHSFGIETLTAEGLLGVEQLEGFLRDYLSEAGALESAFCRAAYRLAKVSGNSFERDAWLTLNLQLSAFKPARESRVSSAILGRRFLLLVSELTEWPLIEEALEAAKQAGIEIHHSTAFGLAGGALELAEETTLLAYGHQVLANLIYACQRLLPLGQSRASRICWNLKPLLVEIAERSCAGEFDPDAVACHTPLVELGSMRHPTLATRLFIS
ncbi:MAG TPA: urease accessory UreF family protein [Pyrinomonadaceae bacterium]|nr:urease accessory UreF family protein [Pyrinomonadaceae bacterium]